MRSSPRLGTAALAAGAAGWLGAIVAVPVLPVGAAAFVYAVGSIVCHQQAERSFHWHEAQLAVCARCTGIYAGAALALLVAWVAGSRVLGVVATRDGARRWLTAAAAPTLVTVAAEWVGWWEPSGLVRACAGVPLGAAAALVVAAAVSTLHYGECLPRAAAPPQPRPPQTPI